jgi:hypothetical protein
VLVGIEHWTAELPAWPLLRALAAGRNMASRTHLADTVADAARLLGGDVSANPSPPRGSRQIARDLLL